MPDFEFDPSLSPDANIDLFYTHLVTVDPQLADLLKTNMHRLAPLPSDQERTKARTIVNQVIRDAILAPKPEGKAAPDCAGE